jgi:hypothetical protein
MQLVMVNHIINEEAESLGEALQDQLNLLKERDFKPEIVYIDPASGLMSLRTQFPGVLIDLCGAGTMYLKKIYVYIDSKKCIVR